VSHLGDRDWWAVKGTVGWLLSIGKAQEGRGIWPDPLDAENQGR